MWACCSVAQSCQTPCDPTDCSTPGFPVLTLSGNLFKLMSMESVMPSNHLTLCHPLLLLLSVFLSIRVFPSMWAQQSNKNIQRTCWRALCLPKGPSLHGSHQAVGRPPPPDTPPPASIFEVLTLGEAGPPAGPHQRPAWRGVERPLDSWPLDLNKLSGHSGSG